MWIIKRIDGAYVTPPGSPGSYTQYLQKARMFPTQESAQRECCPENERVVRIEEELPYPRY